jgi:hypothetical protein
MVGLGHEKVVAYDTTFETNDEKVLSSIYPQWFIFPWSTWSSQLMNILLKSFVVYAHGLQWMAKWSSHGLDLFTWNKSVDL